MTINSKENTLSSPKRPISGLYVITCLINKKRYIGQSNNVPNRLSSHLSRLKKNIHDCRELQKDFNCFSKDQFLFQRLPLGEGCSQVERISLETNLIQACLIEKLYNQFSNFSFRKGDKNPFYGRSHNQETKEKISIANTGSFHRLSKAVVINEIYYISISEAERQTKIARKLIRERCHSKDPIFISYQWFSEKDS